MGIDKVNASVWAHRDTSASATDYTLHAHQQNISLDSSSSAATATQWGTLKQNLGSQSAFDTEATTIWGSWYSAQPTAVKATFRDIVANL